MIPARTRGPVLVVGSGLLGASVGLGLRRLGVPVQLADLSPTMLGTARDLGAGEPAGGDSPPPALVVVATPPDVTASVVAQQLARFPQAVVTDVASVKSLVRQQVEQILAAQDRSGDAARYVGGHPMAGRERSGAIAAKQDLFVGRPWVICAADDVPAAAVDAVRDLATDLNATPVSMGALEHDQAVAAISHAPQLLSSLIAAQLTGLEDRDVALAGQGLRDVTRIAASDPTLWVQILGANAGPVARVLSRLRDDLDVVLEALASLESGAAQGGYAALAHAIHNGNLGQARIPGKHGGDRTEYYTTTVLVPDRPGQLARLIADIGDAGINLEDFEMEHAAGAPVGLLTVSVIPSAAGKLDATLSERGWTVAG